MAWAGPSAGPSRPAACGWSSPTPPGVPGVDRSLDVTDAAAARALAAELSPQVWVNNAGVLGTGDALAQDDDEVRRVVDVNLLGVVHGTRAAASAWPPGPAARS